MPDVTTLAITWIAILQTYDAIARWRSARFWAKAMKASSTSTTAPGRSDGKSFVRSDLAGRDALRDAWGRE